MELMPNQRAEKVAGFTTEEGKPNASDHFRQPFEFLFVSSFFYFHTPLSCKTGLSCDTWIPKNFGNRTKPNSKRRKKKKRKAIRCSSSSLVFSFGASLLPEWNLPPDRLF